MSWWRNRLATLAMRLAGSDAPRRGMSIRTKFLLMILLTSLIGLGTISYLAFQSGRQSLTESAFKRLTSYRSAKKQEIEWYFRNLRDAFSVLGENPAVVAAFADLKSGYALLGKETLAEDRYQRLKQYYAEELLPQLADDAGVIPQIEDYLPRSPAALEVQALYIAENPKPKGYKQDLDYHGSENPYNTAHANHHPGLRRFAEELQYYDLIFVDGESGDIVYSVMKETDLGTNVNTGPGSSSNLSQLAREIIRERKRGAVRLADFAFYEPSFNAPAAFMGVPMFDERGFLGVLIAQISTEAMDIFLHAGHNWREQGLGETGSAYLTGPDLTMRSNTREMIEDPEKYLKRISDSGIMAAPKFARMSSDRTTILYYPVNSESVFEASRGNSGTKVVKSRKGGNVLLSYSPLAIPDLNWILIARMEESEVLASQYQFSRTVLAVACGLALLSTLAALWLARSFLKPVTALLGGIERLSKGERGVIIPQSSRDEFGELVRAFNSMVTDIRSRDDVIESKNKAYSQLLRRIFPDAVADRLKQGEANITQSFSQITVIHVIIEGLALLPKSIGAKAAANILNEVVDTFDDAASQEGIEKIKTIGDHYLAVSGLDVARLDHAKRALDFTVALHRELSIVNQMHGIELKLRAGLAAGPAQAGLVGNRRFVFDLWGRAPSIASRIVHEAALDSVRLNKEAYEAIGDKTIIGEPITVETRAHGTLITYQLSFASALADTRRKRPGAEATASSGVKLRSGRSRR